MKFAVERTNEFKRDFKRIQKCRYCESKLLEVITLLCLDHHLPARCRAHKLTGNYKGCWECHIEPDWLLIYSYSDATVQLIRTGTHADLFG